MQSTIPKLLLLLISTLIALGISELVVRLAGLDPEIVHVEKGRYRLSNNTKLGYEPVPNLEYSGKSLHFFDYRGASNKLGYRDREHSRAKPPGSQRIVILGDSITAGQSVAKTTDVFPAVLERLLRADGTDAEVINFGVSGYNTQQEVETLRTLGLEFRPDLVVLAFCLNDVEQNDGGILRTLVAEAKGSITSAGSESWLHQSALYRALYYRVFRQHQKRPEAYVHMAQNTVAENFVKLKELSQANRFEVLVAVFPDLSMLNNYQRQGEHDTVAALAAAQGFRTLDLLTAFQDCGSGLGHDRYHPSARGHRCAAEAMAANIRRHGIVR